MLWHLTPMWYRNQCCILDRYYVTVMHTKVRYKTKCEHWRSVINSYRKYIDQKLTPKISHAKFLTLNYIYESHRQQKKHMPQSWKVIWDSINTLSSWNWICQTYFWSFLLAHPSICARFSGFPDMLKSRNSEIKTTQNTLRDCHVHFGQPFST